MNTDYKNTNFSKFGCNQFVISGKTTLNDEIFHGRDFMFSTADIYQDISCVMVYLPDDGKPFVTVAAPGFVAEGRQARRWRGGLKNKKNLFLL